MMALDSLVFECKKAREQIGKTSGEAKELWTSLACALSYVVEREQERQPCSCKVAGASQCGRHKTLL